ncbi:hypothetical protein BDR04DRAFT_463347 [Suillus decipiens]|nr:hypothetical protein BDR04DRAFT_463347 [Suillus decipiens]
MIFKDAAMHILRPVAAKGSIFTAANGVIHTGIATIIVLEYYAFSSRTRISGSASSFLWPTACDLPRLSQWKKERRKFLVKAIRNGNWGRRFLSSSLSIACQPAAKALVTK